MLKLERLARDKLVNSLVPGKPFKPGLIFSDKALPANFRRSLKGLPETKAGVIMLG
jgi:hypothetical protein